MIQEDGDDGQFKVLSNDSDEVRKTTHSGCFVVNSERQGYTGKCLMVQSSNSEMKVYATDGGKVVDNCFSTKTIKKLVSECKRVV